MRGSFCKAFSGGPYPPCGMVQLSQQRKRRIPPGPEAGLPKGALREHFDKWRFFPNKKRKELIGREQDL